MRRAHHLKVHSKRETEGKGGMALLHSKKPCAVVNGSNEWRPVGVLHLLWNLDSSVLAVFLATPFHLRHRVFDSVELHLL